MYIPKIAVSLETITTKQQIRLGIQGAPKTGKTYASTSFPNPVFINLDRGLGAHSGKPIHEIPVWDKKIVTDAKTFLESFLNTEALELSHEQTLVLDGNTGIENAFNAWSVAHPVYSKGGATDDFAKWRQKIEFYGNIIESLKRLRCNTIYICHEIPDRDSKGELNGKLRPLLTGQFADQLASHFTDWVRQLCVDKKSLRDNGNHENWGLSNKEDFTKIIFPLFPDSDSIYYWQLQPDSLCNCATSSLIRPPRYIPALYGSFIKYIPS
jgi:hypothetical protein